MIFYMRILVIDLFIQEGSVFKDSLRLIHVYVYIFRMLGLLDL